LAQIKDELGLGFIDFIDTTGTSWWKMQLQFRGSLQASNEEQQERRDVMQAKLHLERPYNSLKVSDPKNGHVF